MIIFYSELLRDTGRDKMREFSDNLSGGLMNRSNLVLNLCWICVEFVFNVVLNVVDASQLSKSMLS